MEPDKKVDFIKFRDLVLNRANNLLFCFDGTITTLREKSSKEFFFKQTFSEMIYCKEFRNTIDYKKEEFIILKIKHKDLMPITNTVTKN